MARAHVFALLVVALVVVLVSAEDTYDEGRWSHINVEEVTGNKRILGSFIKCFLDQGPCTADAKDMKQLLPEVVETSCGKCTKTQKQLMARAMKYVRDNHPDDWKELCKKYDPEDKRAKNLDEFVDQAMKE